MSNQTIQSKARDAAYTAVAALSRMHLTVATAESCTGGLIAKLITDVSGASAVFEGGIASYSNAMKVSVLGVNPETLKKFGAVSPETAVEMAEGARRVCSVDIAVSSTGIAGPAGGTPEKPVGTVCIAVSSEKHSETLRLALPENAGRDAIRYATAEAALALVAKTTEFYK